jgi:trk system potassium uptake protein TrkH
LTPPQLFIGSFAILIGLGTVGMRTLPGLFAEAPLTWEESLFTVTSAVCVTGLTVVDTATRFSPLGQAYVLLLIQLGGLGMIVFTSLIILALGGRLSLRHESLAVSAAETAAIAPRRLVFDIVRFTFTIEAIGAMLLYAVWIPQYGWQGAAWPALFHSVSAFCNAGFSIFSDNLMSHQQSPATLVAIMVLIVFGGLGFLALEEISPLCFPRRHKRALRVSLHTRIVLWTTAVLILGGGGAFGWLEWNNALNHLPVFDRVTNAFFMSVTTRTAGFNSIDYAQAADSTNFLTILLMMIGGSPGSTAGGIKTTTFALLGILAWSRLRGEETASLFGRSLPKYTLDRAIGLFVIAFGIVTLGILVLTMTERSAGSSRFLEQMFEAVSAFNTVGLSVGVTPTLSSPGRLAIIVLMFVGRVGPLSVAAALARPTRVLSQFRYAYEDVMVG